MAAQRPLPKKICTILESCLGGMHPGLHLDKFAESFLGAYARGSLQENVQKPTLNHLSKLTNEAVTQQGALFNELRNRHELFCKQLRGTIVTATAQSPIALHLARASSLENGSVCLHPVYGFAYIPGSGLKGLAQAYAYEVWLPAQENREDALRNILKVFGHAPSPLIQERVQSIGTRLEVNFHEVVKSETKTRDSWIGGVVFHDAWPTAWPKLLVDILNNHHSKYYQATQAATPPGDWEDPIPVYFPAIASGTKFEFCVSPRKRHQQGVDKLVDLAIQWLSGGISYLGVGAKTNGGYGRLSLDSIRRYADQDGSISTNTIDVEGIRSRNKDQQIHQNRLRSSFECKIALVTPAILSGADQTSKDDCDLRPSTLRGQLRWWWRTMHTNHVDSNTLQRMETALWGNASLSGAIQLTIKRISKENPNPISGKIQQNANPVNNQQVPGLVYAAYGTYDRNNGKTRYVLEQGTWQLEFNARNCDFGTGKVADGTIRIDSETVLQQAKSALWLLCRYGGVGAKSRKGFGSLAAGDLGLSDLNEVTSIARSFRNECRVTAGSTGTASMESATFAEGIIQFNDLWKVLHAIGETLRSFAQSPTNTGHGKHCYQKAALGLPRKIDGPNNTPLQHRNQINHRRPTQLESSKGSRHASPLMFHVARINKDTYLVRATIFPNRYLWADRTGREGQRGNIGESDRLWRQLHEYLSASFQQNPFRSQDDLDRSQAAAVTMPAIAIGEMRAEIMEYVPRTRQWNIKVVEGGTGLGFLDSATIPNGIKIRKGDIIRVEPSDKQHEYRFLGET